MSATDTYCASAGTMISAGSMVLFNNREDGHVRVLDPLEARLWGCVQGVKTLDAHAVAMWQANLCPDPLLIARAVDRLIAVGAVRPSNGLTRLDRSLDHDSREISTVGTVTADRPDLLERALASIVGQCEEFGHAPRLLVIDGSRHEPNRRATAAVCQQATRRSGRAVEYVGADQAADLRQAIGRRTGCPPDVLAFGLTPGPIGANRNLLLLMAAGELLMMSDDDVVLEPWASEEVSDSVVMAGHADLRINQFFSSRHEALAAAGHVRADLLGAHARFLGAALPDILASAPSVDAGQACPHQVESLERTTDCVRATFAGLAGDSGIWCPYRMLFASGPLRGHLGRSAEMFALALRSREVLRIAPSATITHDATCMTYCAGIANHQLTPPFMPEGRGEDGLFGAMLAHCEPRASFAHLPYGIRHDSPREPAYEGPLMASARGIRLADVIVSAVRAMPPVVSTIEAALAQLAAQFATISCMSGPDFSDWLSTSILDRRCGELARLDTRAVAGGDYPDYWRAAIREYREVLLTEAAGPGFFIPAEWKSNISTRRDATTRLQDFVRSFGELVKWWPVIWADCRRSRRESGAPGRYALNGS